MTPWCCGEDWCWCFSNVPVRIQTVDSDDSSARHEIEDEHDDGENQKDMDPSSQRVAADESEDPENEENDGNCPKHLCTPRRLPGLTSPVRRYVQYCPYRVIRCRTRGAGCQWE